MILFMHQREAVIDFLETACRATALILVGRLITPRLTALAGRRGVVRYHTVLVGGGPLAAELAKIKEDLNANDIDAASKIIAGTAWSMGITVE